MKIFLSGPMTGEPDWGRPAFMEAATVLRRLGFTVFNPAESFGGDVTRPRTDYMRVCFAALLDCEALVSLPRWSSSKGAYLERKMAEELGLPVDNYATFIKGQPGETPRMEVSHDRIETVVGRGRYPRAQDVLPDGRRHHRRGGCRD